MGGTLTTMSPVFSFFSPVIGSGVASVGIVMKGIGALGDAGKPMMTHSEFHPREIWRIINGIRDNDGVDHNAYTRVQGIGQPA